MQYFERPKELMTGEQQDDLLFFVVHEAYQVLLQPQIAFVALCMQLCDWALQEVPQASMM